MLNPGRAAVISGLGVVSPLGTALTEQQVAILRRFADRIVFLLDADAAGDNAVDRLVSLFLTQPVEIAVASLPADQDPDEYLLKEGAEAFERLIAAAPDALSYKWTQLNRRLKEEGDSLTATQKVTEQEMTEKTAGQLLDWVSEAAGQLSCRELDRANELFMACHGG